MSFQSYIKNVENSTGVSIDQLVATAQVEGLSVEGGLARGVMPKQVLSWLQDKYGLGHGHAMAVVAYIKGKRS